MTTYNGGKKRLAKHIYKAIASHPDYTPDKPYFEPFCGMASVMAELSKNEPDRKGPLIASDINPDIISMWQSLQQGWIPPLTVTEEYYNELKASTDPSPERGFVGPSCSFGAQFFGTYKNRHDSRQLDLPGIAWRSTQKVLPYLMNVDFKNSYSYDTFNPTGMVIYCDPPYKGNKLHYKYFQHFDHTSFWNTVREWSKTNLVFVSELQAPEDFVPVWRKDYNVTFMTNYKNKKNINKTNKYRESVFVHQTLN